MKNIFICYTPYHFLLSFLFKGRGDDDLIVFIDQYNNLEEWAVVLKGIKNSKFVAFEYARSIFKLTRVLKKILKDWRLKSKQIEAVYIFNDRAKHTWIALNCIRTKNIFYIEDGSSAYSNSKIKTIKVKEIIFRILSKIPYLKYKYVEVLGTSPMIVGGYYLYPNNVRDENKIKPIFQYEKSDENLTEITRIFLKLFNFNLKNESSLLVLLPSLSDVSFFNEFNKIAEEVAISNDQLLLIKNHPLDKNYKNIIKQKNIEALPSFYPAEAAIITGKSQAIIGSFTTALYVSKFLFENCTVINVSTKESREENILFYNFLSEINVQQIQINVN